MLNRKQLAELVAIPASGRNRIAAALELAGQTQVDLAEAIGVTQAYVSKLCTDAYGDLPLGKAQSIADFFGCSTDVLFPPKTEAA